MCTDLVRAALKCTSLTLRVLPGVPVNTELPSRHKGVTLRPMPSGTAGELSGDVRSSPGSGRSPLSMAPRSSGPRGVVSVLQVEPDDQLLCSVFQ
jgi:hypothetical protein